MRRENGWDELNKYQIKTKKNRELLIVFKSEFIKANIDFYEL